MWKFKLFLFLETILAVLALVTMLAHDLSRVLILSILFLLMLYYHRGGQRNHILLLAAFVLFFFVTVFNPFVLAGLGLAVFYLYFILPSSWQELKKKTIWEAHDASHQTSWWGDREYFSQGDCQFDDLNLVRLSGRDVIHLDEVLISQHDNVIVLRKVFGDTKILVPLDVAVSLQVSSLYGEVRFFDEEVSVLRNASLSRKTSDYGRATKSVKIVISGLAGKLEVVRA